MQQFLDLTTLSRHFQLMSLGVYNRLSKGRGVTRRRQLCRPAELSKKPARYPLTGLVAIHIIHNSEKRFLF